MSHYRLIPLLIVGAACLPLAACGGDDEPAASATQPGAPAETAPAAPGDASADASPATTTDGSAAKDGAADSAAPSSGGATPSDDGDAPATEAAPEKADEPAGESDAKPKARDRESSSKRSSATSSAASGSSSESAKDRSAPAPDVPKALKDYAKGGAPATADQAASVRKTMLEFQAALVAQDAGKACAYTHGLPAKSEPGNPMPSCESLIQGSNMAPPTAQDRELIRTAKITVSGDRASIEMGGSGVPMPFRKVDGRWRIDYGTLLGIAGSAG